MFDKNLTTRKKIRSRLHGSHAELGCRVLHLNNNINQKKLVAHDMRIYVYPLRRRRRFLFLVLVLHSLVSELTLALSTLHGSHLCCRCLPQCVLDHRSGSAVTGTRSRNAGKYFHNSDPCANSPCCWASLMEPWRAMLPEKFERHPYRELHIQSSIFVLYAAAHDNGEGNERP